MKIVVLRIFSLVVGSLIYFLAYGFAIWLVTPAAHWFFKLLVARWNSAP